MEDKDIRKLASYIVEELTKPSDDLIEKVGFHVAFFNQKQMEDYYVISIKHEIEQLEKLMKYNVEMEDYETASLIKSKIADLKQGLNGV